MFEHVEAVVGPYVAPPLVCRDYDPRAADVAREIGGLVTGHLTQVRVEHVGSTAVPGGAGTGIVDLLIPIAAVPAETLKLLLARLGFQVQADGERSLYVGVWSRDQATFPLHVHLLPAAAPEADEMRFFRTCLRADPELLRAYVACKREILAQGVTDPQEYARRKGEFVRTVLG